METNITCIRCNNCGFVPREEKPRYITADGRVFRGAKPCPVCRMNKQAGDITLPRGVLAVLEK